MWLFDLPRWKILYILCDMSQIRHTTSTLLTLKPRNHRLNICIYLITLKITPNNSCYHRNVAELKP